ncbi:MAG: copper homeostasis protein CutC [Gemmatimonadota bacterium]|nr:copper homeostasis protein CutC [Gemmatimonadota bacterium]
MPALYEACATSVAQARAAQRAGADRLELCARIGTGGLTPPIARVAATRAAVKIPIHVMIRPRPGNFVYTTGEIAEMRRCIAAVRKVGADGVVLGALTPGGGIDTDALAHLLESADGLSVTFHRAFDEVTDPLVGLEHLVALGVDRILTSGGAPTARSGTPMLRKLVIAARGRIEIIACGTVRAANAKRLMAAAGVTEIHAHLQSPGDMRALALVIHAEPRW